jgi:hypothetical protein
MVIAVIPSVTKRWPIHLAINEVFKQEETFIPYYRRADPILFEGVGLPKGPTPERVQRTTQSLSLVSLAHYYPNSIVPRLPHTTDGTL